LSFSYLAKSIHQHHLVAKDLVASKPLVLDVVLGAVRTERHIAIQALTNSPDFDGVLKVLISVVSLEADSTESIGQIVLLLCAIVLVQSLRLLALQPLSNFLILRCYLIISRHSVIDR